MVFAYLPGSFPEAPARPEGAQRVTECSPKLQDEPVLKPKECLKTSIQIETETQMRVEVKSTVEPEPEREGIVLV